MKRILITIALASVMGCPGFAQSPADSLRFFDPRQWETSVDSDGIVIRELSSKHKQEESYLFGSPQHICVMEIDATRYKLGLAQEAKKRTVSKLIKANDALGGVNGGFYVVHTKPKAAAVSGDFLKINGVVVSPYPTTGWGSAAVGFNDGMPGFTQWNKAMDADTLSGWSSHYTHVVAAGPMLRLKGQDLHNGDNSRHPRTAIGTRGEHTIVLLVVDGRNARKAGGASLEEMVVLGRWLGLDNMMNLDGGGSSTMIYRKRLFNFPSDGLGLLPIERKIANAVLVYRK